MENLKEYFRGKGYQPVDYFGSVGMTGADCVRSLNQEPCFFESSFFSILKVTGNDRQSYLNGQTSNDILKLSPGCGHSSSLNTPKGKTLSLLNIFQTEDAFYLQYPTFAHEKLLEQLNLYLFTEDVVLEPISNSFSVTFPGRKSLDAISNRLKLEPVEDSHYQILVSEGYLILVGKLLNIPSLTIFELVNKSLKIPDGFKPICTNFLETQRIFNLYPMAQIEYEFEKTLTPELDQENIISYSKGCFVGQEVFARIRTYGRTNRMLAAMVFPDDEKESLKGLEILVNGSSRGTITSDIKYGSQIHALGYLPTAHKTIGGEVQAGNLTGKIIA